MYLNSTKVQFEPIQKSYGIKIPEVLVWFKLNFGKVKIHLKLHSPTDLSQFHQWVHIVWWTHWYNLWRSWCKETSCCDEYSRICSASSNDLILGTLINYEYSGDLSLSSITSSKHGSTIKYSISLRIFFQFTYFIYQHQILFFYIKFFSFPFQVAQGVLMNLLIGYLIVSNRWK